MKTQSMYRNAEAKTSPEDRLYNRAVTALEITGMTRPEAHRRIGLEAKRLRCSKQSIAIEILEEA